MTSRSVAGLILSLAALFVTGCGSGDSRGETDSPMERCGDGRTMTVTDPARDGLSPSEAPAERRRAVADNPDAFDLLRVLLKTGNGVLCVSATFAAGDPSGERVIGLSVAPARPRLDPDIPLARLTYGRKENVASLAEFGAIQSEPVSGESTSGVRGRVVEFAVPLNELFVVSERAGSVLDHRSFTWRIGTTSDCIPGPRQLIRYPTGERLGLPGSPERQINAVAPAGCRGA